MEKKNYFFLILQNQTEEGGWIKFSQGNASERVNEQKADVKDSEWRSGVPVKGIQTPLLRLFSHSSP